MPQHERKKKNRSSVIGPDITLVVLLPLMVTTKINRNSQTVFYCSTSQQTCREVYMQRDCALNGSIYLVCLRACFVQLYPSPPGTLISCSAWGASQSRTSRLVRGCLCGEGHPSDVFLPSLHSLELEWWRPRAQAAHSSWVPLSRLSPEPLIFLLRNKGQCLCKRYESTGKDLTDVVEGKWILQIQRQELQAFIQTTTCDCRL